MPKRKKTDKVDRLCFVAKQVAEGRIQYDELEHESRVLVHAPSRAVFGSVVLIASETGQFVDAVGVVVGQPTHYKHKKTLRDVFVTHRLAQSRLRLGQPLAGRSYARMATDGELDGALTRARSTPSASAFVLETALLMPGATITQESRCAGFLADCAQALEGFRATTELRVAGSQNSQGREGVAAARVDLVITLPPTSNRRRALVLETEWSKVGAAESAGQAFEYAARLRRSGWFDGGEQVGLSTAAIKKAELLPMVVANNVPDVCFVSDKLEVARMDYSAFLTRLSHRNFDGLTAIRLR